MGTKAAAAAGGDVMDGYGEPWELVKRSNPEDLECFRGDRCVKDVDGRTPIQGMEIDGHRIKERAILCVNACEGLTNEDIRRRGLVLGHGGVARWK
jgi:hypothetical protein